MPRMERKIVQGNPIPILNMHYDESINRAIASSMNYPLPVAFGDSASIDAFGRGRVSEPYTVFDSKLIYDKNALYFDEVITNTSGNATSTYNGDNAQVQMYVEAGDEIIRQSYQRFNYQSGKALKNGEPVLTPDGWVNIEDIKIGDIVFDGLGKKTRVIGVYPQGIRKIYRITFDDGTYVDCDGEHLWKTIKRQNKRKGEVRILTTNQMLEEYGENPPRHARWRIPQSPVLEIEEKEIEIDAYTLGAILGDGSIDENGYVCFTTADQEILDNIKAKITKRNDERNIHYGICGLQEPIKSYKINGKICDEKFIPDEYKYNSKKIRLGILQGLMDTDGTVDKDCGTATFSSTSIRLAKDLAFIVRSLGGQAKIKERNTFYRNDDGNKIYGKKSYRVSVIIPICPFRLKRKAKYWNPRTRISFDRYIHTINEIGNYEATCIRVNSDDHTFLTRNNIVTHNSQLSFLTYNMMGYANGCIKRVGLFDENNGVFCEINGDTLSYVIRKNGVDRGVPQWAWNQDTLNGSEDQSNPSGIEIDMTKTQISIIDFEWLGVGRVRVGFVIDGIPIYVHEFNHANVETSVYMSTPNLPVRYEVSTMGESCQLNHICSTVISEGGVQPNGSIRFMDSGSYVNANVAGTEYVICGIRLKTTHFDTQVDIERMSLLATTNVNFRWRLHLDPTTSAALTWADVPNSSIQFGVGALDPVAVGDTITAAGTIIGGGFGSNNVDAIEADIKNALRLGASIGGVPNEIILAVTPYTNNEDIYGAFEWREI